MFTHDSFKILANCMRTFCGILKNLLCARHEIFKNAIHGVNNLRCYIVLIIHFEIF
jgi:hypothetical protein